MPNHPEMKTNRFTQMMETDWLSMRRKVFRGSVAKSSVVGVPRLLKQACAIMTSSMARILSSSMLEFRCFSRARGSADIVHVIVF